jgi:hypothetical protein
VGHYRRRNRAARMGSVPRILRAGGAKIKETLTATMIEEISLRRMMIVI